MTHVMAHEEILSRTDFFADAHPDALRNVAAAGHERHLIRGDVLFNEGDPPNALYLVLHGRMAIAIANPIDRRESVVALMEPDDLFGEMGMLDDGPRSAMARALEPTTVLEIPFEPVLTMFDEHPKLLWNVTRMLAQRIRVTDEALADSVFLDVTGRTAKRLLELADGEDQFTLPVTQEELAGMVGASREARQQGDRQLHPPRVARTAGPHVQDRPTRPPRAPRPLRHRPSRPPRTPCPLRHRPSPPPRTPLAWPVRCIRAAWSGRRTGHNLRSQRSPIMFLALKEMRRAKVAVRPARSPRIGLLVFLILFQQSLQNGLLTAFVGAIRNQSAPVLVYSVDGQRMIQGSVITPELEPLVARRRRRRRRSAGSARARSPCTDADGELDRRSSATIGTRRSSLGAPARTQRGPATRPAAGEAVGSDADAADGFGLGDTVVIEPDGFELEDRRAGRRRPAERRADAVHRLRRRSPAAVRSANPDAGEPLPNVIGVAPGRRRRPTRSSSTTINAQSDDLDALTRRRRRRRDARRRPGPAIVPGDLLALRPRRAVRDRAVLPHHHVPEGRARSRLLRAIGAPARDW